MQIQYFYFLYFYFSNILSAGPCLHLHVIHFKHSTCLCECTYAKQRTNSECDFSDKLYLKKLNKNKLKSNKQNHVITIQHKGNKLSRQHGNMVAVCACLMCRQKTDMRVFYRATLSSCGCFHWLIKFTHKNKERSSLAEGYALFKARGL